MDTIESVTIYRCCDRCFKAVKDGGIHLGINRKIIGSDEETPVVVCNECAGQIIAVEGELI